MKMVPNFEEANTLWTKYLSLTKDANGISYLRTYDAVRDRWLDTNKITKAEHQRILTSSAASIYVKEILPYLIPIMQNGGDIMVVEDATLYRMLTHFLDLLGYEEDLQDEMFNIYFCSAGVEPKDTSKYTKLSITSRLDLEEVLPMKNFDAIIGNPPYAYVTNGRSIAGRGFWHDFSAWSFNHVKKDGLVSLITPDNWLISDQYNNLEVRHGHNLVKTGSVEFADAVVSARYWIALNQNYEGNTDFDGTDCDMTKLPYYPLNGEYVSVFEKVFDKTSMISLLEGTSNRTGYFNPQTKEKNEIHIYPIYFSNSVINYSQNPSHVQHLKKVMVSKNASWKPWFDNGESGCNESIWYKLVENEGEGKSLVDYLSSKVIRFILKTSRRRMSIATNVLKNIPIVPLDRAWTDEELYEYFDFTADEINLIESVIKS